jgi:hypothetical protein
MEQELKGKYSCRTASKGKLERLPPVPGMSCVKEQHFEDLL